MKVIIYGQTENTVELSNKVKNALNELWLNDFIEVEETNSEIVKEELGISVSPALIIEEESIDFKDIIFEGMSPDEEELKSMFLSIVWGGEENSSCWSSCCEDDGCDDESSCSSWCSCGH